MNKHYCRTCATMEHVQEYRWQGFQRGWRVRQMMASRRDDNEKTCGSCYWFTKIDKPVSQVTHYCKLHYMQQARKKNDKACSNWYKGGKRVEGLWRAEHG